MHLLIFFKLSNALAIFACYTFCYMKHISIHGFPLGLYSFQTELVRAICILPVQVVKKKKIGVSLDSGKD